MMAHALAKDLKIGEGGETYIATDEWCHYCGEGGHLGDVSGTGAIQDFFLSHFLMFRTASPGISPHRHHRRLGCTIS
jgi:hypothetical protein